MDASTVRLSLLLPEALASSKRRFLVAIDEFQELASLAKQRPRIDAFAIMRSAWQGQGRVAYVISGSGRPMLEELVASRSSPFFQRVVSDERPATAAVGRGLPG